MMWWNGSWAWAWMIMVPMMALVWALIAWVIMPRRRNENTRSPSPVERLDERLAASEISVDEYRTLRAELESRP